jgi:hypothetical protein
MSYEAFMKPLDFLRPVLAIICRKSMNRTSNQTPIGPELILNYTLRYLAGASYLDVLAHTGISRTFFNASVYKGIDAICGCDELAFKMPMTLSELVLLPMNLPI